MTSSLIRSNAELLTLGQDATPTALTLLLAFAAPGIPIAFRSLQSAVADHRVLAEKAAKEGRNAP